jgi:hypothetical protein
MTTQSHGSSDRKHLMAFAALAAGQAAVYGLMARSDVYLERPAAAMYAALLAFALYLGGLGAAGRLSGRAALALAAAAGLVFRALLFPEPPFLSDDYFRYLWDGVVQTNGINPYAHAPADTALAGIDDALRSQVNHPTVPTIYPPLVQIVFALNALAGGGWLGLKLVWLACDVGIAALLYRLVPRHRRLQMWTLYWWSPLVVIEVAWSAHLDVLGILPLALAIWLSRSPRPRSIALGLTIAAAAAAKYFAAALLPAAARRARPSRVISAFAVGTLLLSLAYVGAGRHMFDGLVTFAAHWRFNESLFGLLDLLLTSSLAAKAMAALVLLFIVVQSVRKDWSLERTAFWVTGGILLLSPTVHPWYLLWMVPLVAIRFSRAWLYLTGSIFLAYFGLETFKTTGVWPEPWWVRLVIYGPFFAMLVVDAWRGSQLPAATAPKP